MAVLAPAVPSTFGHAAGPIPRELVQRLPGVADGAHLALDPRLVVTAITGRLYTVQRDEGNAGQSGSSLFVRGWTEPGNRSA